MKKLLSTVLCIMLLIASAMAVNGEGSTVFTRIEALKLVAENVTYTKNEYECPFTDIKDEDKSLVGYAFEKGWIKGTGNNLFNPDASITRECFLTIVLRSLKYTDPLSFTWDNPYDRAFIAGIYPVRHEGDFTKAEAEDILEKRKSAYVMYSPRHSNNEWDLYTENLSYVSSQTGKLDYLFDLENCTVVIGYVTGTPHGAAPKGYVVFKNDGKAMSLTLPRVSPWKSAAPENVYLSEDDAYLYYTCTVEKDYIGMDGVTLVQEAGVFEYCVDLAQRTIDVKKL